MNCPAFSDIVFVSHVASDISLQNQPHCLDLKCTAAAANILKKMASLQYISLSLNRVRVVFQGLLCGGGATEEATRREVPKSLGGARPDEPG